MVLTKMMATFYFQQSSMNHYFYLSFGSMENRALDIAFEGKGYAVLPAVEYYGCRSRAHGYPCSLYLRLYPPCSQGVRLSFQAFKAFAEPVNFLYHARTPVFWVFVVNSVNCSKYYQRACPHLAGYKSRQLVIVPKRGPYLVY